MVAQPDRSAELAVAVADAHQGAGLGPAMIRLMLGVAARHGIETVVALVRCDNERTMHVLRRLRFERTAWELGVVTFTVRTRATQAARASAASSAQARSIPAASRSTSGWAAASAMTTTSR